MRDELLEISRGLDYKVGYGAEMLDHFFPDIKSGFLIFF